MIPQKILESISQYMLRIFNLRKEQLVGGDENEILLSLAENEEEAEDIKEICEEIDLYYEERKRLQSSGLKAYKYLEQRALEMYKEDNPEATEEECDHFVDDLRENLDVVIASNAAAFSQETNEDCHNNTENVEKFVQMVEDHLNNGQDVELPQSNS